jgi:hypothetical protein
MCNRQVKCESEPRVSDAGRRLDAKTKPELTPVARLSPGGTGLQKRLRKRSRPEPCLELLAAARITHEQPPFRRLRG